MCAMALKGVRVIEYASGLAGRTAGLLLADQGASVVICRKDAEAKPIDAFLDRSKFKNDKGAALCEAQADIVICDDVPAQERSASQIRLSFPAVVPGDKVYPFPADVSEDIIRAEVGMYTDLASARKIIGEQVTYTSLPLPSVYAAVIGAAAAAAALVDRTRCGYGREIAVPRMAAGLAAIGVFPLEVGGLPPHLAPGALIKAPSPDMAEKIERAKKDPEFFEWLKHRVNPLASCYKAADGRLVALYVNANARIARGFLDQLGIWEEMEAAGMVDRDVYEPENRQYAARNIFDPSDLSNDLRAKLADLVEQKIAEKPAIYWEQTLSRAGVVCSVVREFDDWRASEQARACGLSVDVDGCDYPQLGRAVRIDSARPYPKLNLAQEKPEGLLEGEAEAEAPCGAKPSGAPLAGYKVLGLSNVIAGPACERLLAELGADIVKVDSTHPLHIPVITVMWSGEMGQGKRSILLDPAAPEGREILHRMAKNADMVVSNKLDPVLDRMGLGRKGLPEVNPKAVGVQIAAWKGENPTPYDDFPGYDPILQSSTGIMARLGRPEAPELHGVASAVDYLTGYLGAFSGIAALYAREVRGDGTGDYTDTSLESGASLVQLCHLVEPEKVGDPRCLRKTNDGFICISPADAPLPGAEEMTAAEACEAAKAAGFLAVPVQSVAQLKSRHRGDPCATIRFRQSEGDFPALVFRPTWLLFDGDILPEIKPAPLPGADAKELLTEFGYTDEEIEKLVAAKVVGKTLWER